MKSLGFLWADEWYVEDNMAWFIPCIQYNGLFAYNLNTGECRLIKKLSKNPFLYCRNHTKVVKNGDKFLCLPYYSDFFNIYDEKMDTTSEIHIDLDTDEGLKTTFWTRLENGEVYVFSSALQKMIVIDNSFSMVNEIVEIHDGKEEIVALHRVDKYLYSITKNGIVYKYSISEKKYERYIIDNVTGIYLMDYDGEYFWLSGNKREVYKWKIGEKKALVINDFPDAFGGYIEEVMAVDTSVTIYNYPTFVGMASIGEKMVFVPFKSNMILSIDKISNEIGVIQDPFGENEISNQMKNYLGHPYLCQGTIEEKILICHISSGKQYIVDVEGNWKECAVSYQNLDLVAELHEGMLYFGDRLILEDYISLVKEKI